MLGGLLPGQHPVRAPGGGEREVDRTVRPLDRCRLREVVSEHREVRVEVAAAQPHQRLPHAAVQARPAQLADAVVERGAHQGVREGVAPDVPGLAQDARLDALLERLDEFVAGLGDDGLQHVVVELAPDHRAHQQDRPRRLAEAPQPPRGDLAHAVGHARLLERDLLGQRARGVADVAHDLLDEERVAFCLAGERVDERFRGRSAGQLGDQLPHLGLRQAGQLQAPQRPLAAQVADQLVQRMAVGDLALAVGAEVQHPARRGRAHEVAQQLQRRAVGPVQVVEDEHDRRLGADLADQRGDGVEEAVALGVGLRAGDRARRHMVGGRRAELRQQDRQLGRARAQPFAQRVQRGARRPAAQHLDHGLVGRQRLLVEAPVEDRGAVVAGACGEFRRAARLADPGVAGQQHERALAVGGLTPAALEVGELDGAADQRVALDGGAQRRRPR